MAENKGESLKPQEMDRILSLRRVRTSLAEVCNGATMQHLEAVRLRAATILCKIADPELRKQSVDSVVQGQWKLLLVTHYPMEEMREIRGRYYRARSLYLSLNGTAKGMRFFGAGYLRNDKEINELFQKLKRAFGEEKSLAECLDILNRRFDSVVERLGRDCVGKEFFFKGRGESAKISSISETGMIHFKAISGAYTVSDIAGPVISK